ncbi:MAG: hypothetical protein ACQCN6_11680 [Candidatus Bathyarchaeia archaeon]|jgi:hypothetical protein
MKPIKSLENRLRGWIPKDPYELHSIESGNHKSSATAYIVGYGVGIGTGELYILLINMLGWGAIESSLSHTWGILPALLVVFPGTLIGLAIGAKLTKKLKQRWVS